jgi:hypothetical protein
VVGKDRSLAAYTVIAADLATAAGPACDRKLAAITALATGRSSSYTTSTGYEVVPPAQRAESQPAYGGAYAGEGDDPFRDTGSGGGYGSTGGYYDPAEGWRDCTGYDPCYGERNDRWWAEHMEDAGPALDPWGSISGAPGPSYDDPWGRTQQGGNCYFDPDGYGC